MLTLSGRLPEGVDEKILFVFISLRLSVEMIKILSGCLEREI